MKALLKRSGYRSRNHGAILFICLWALVILGILSIGISSRVSSEMHLAKYLGDGVASLYLAKATVNKVILELEKDQTPESDTLYELQQNSQKIELGNTSAAVSITDEASLVNINTTSEAIVASLPGLDVEIAKTIIGWTLKPYLLKEELLVLPEMDSDKFSGINDLITTFTDGRININTASPEVLGLLGLDSSLIEVIVNFRKGADGQEGTLDDGVFENASSIVDTLRLYTILPVLQEQQLQALLQKKQEY